LSFAANTQDQTAQINIARFQQFEAEMENRTLFFSLWWKALDDENAARLLDASGDYRYWLEQMRNFKPYTLSEPEEKIINIKKCYWSLCPRHAVRFHHQPLCIQS